MGEKLVFKNDLSNYAKHFRYCCFGFAWGITTTQTYSLTKDPRPPLATTASKQDAKFAETGPNKVAGGLCRPVQKQSIAANVPSGGRETMPPEGAY